MPTTGFSFSRRRDIYDESGIYALWYFTQRLDEECSRARRTNDPITVVCLQVDGRLGREVGARLRRDVRDYDFIGRVSDGRFLVAVLDAGPEVAGVLTDRLQATTGTAPELAFASFPADGETASSLLSRVQERLVGSAAA